MEDFATILQLWNECTGLRNGTRVPKGGFAAAKYPFKWLIDCENDGSQGVESSQPFRSCETGVLSCEMALVCHGVSLQLRKFSQRRMAAAKPFRSWKPFSQRLTFAAKFRSPCSLLAFWAPLDSQLSSFTSFDIPLDFDHPKTYVTSKQIRIKALKSKLKHWNQN